MASPKKSAQLWAVEALNLTIELKLHLDECNDFLLLESQDMYKHLGENTEDELELAYYIDKWCEYLNYPFLHNQEMAFADGEYCGLDGWIDGFNFAKKIDPVYGDDKITILYKGYTVILHSPRRAQIKESDT